MAQAITTVNIQARIIPCIFLMQVVFMVAVVPQDQETSWLKPLLEMKLICSTFKPDRIKPSVKVLAVVRMSEFLKKAAL